jgi:hypothetical protein
VTCFDTSVQCLQVIRTPTCRVSGYPRQVIKVATLLRRLRFIWTALPTVITLKTIIPLGTYNTSSWYIFFRDGATPLVHLSSLMTAVCLSLMTRLLHWTASFTGRTASFPHCILFSSGLLLLLCFLFYSGPFTGCSPFITLYSLHRGHHVQLFRCRLNGLIVPLLAERVNCCVEKGFRLVAVLSLLRNDFSVAFILVA